MRRRSFVRHYCSLVLLATAASGNAQTTTESATTPLARAVARATADLAIAGPKLTANAHCFAGECSYRTPPEPNGAEQQSVVVPFRGALTEGVDQLWCQDFHVLRHAGHELVRGPGGEFTGPQGDSPDGPLTPRAFAPLLGRGTVTAVRATMHNQRPAMAAHVVWTDKAAAAVADLVAFPSTKHQALLERFPDVVRRYTPEKYCIDALVLYDPAQKDVLAVTLRLAMFGTVEPEQDDEPPTAAPVAASLPPLPKPALFEFRYLVTMTPDPGSTLPLLDARQRERLGLPAK
jgi:hypothetical protein